MFKKNKKKASNNDFYFEQVLDQIDIAMGAFYKNNEFFVLTFAPENSEDVIQVIHRQMAEETQTENGEFGLTVTLEFDKEDEIDLANIKNLKQSKHFGNFIKNEEENMIYYSLLLPQDAEKSAVICSDLLISVYNHKKGNPNIISEFYDVE